MFTINRKFFGNIGSFLFFILLGSSSSWAVVGGEPASELVDSSIVNIVFEKTVCSGTLISENTVLTAAHCKDTGIKATLVAHIDGELVTKECDKAKVVDFAYEPSAQLSPFRRHTPDLLLLKLETPLCSAKPASLRKNAIELSELISLAGHSSYDSIYGVSTEIQVSVIDPLKAQDYAYAKPDSFAEGMIKRFLNKGAKNYMTAIPLKPGSSMCPGDSGGPVFVEKDKEMLVLGVNGAVVANEKLGAETCGYAYVQFFTPVAPYIDWIESKVKEWKPASK